jgi:DNA-binding GntR family transcriptional regulator
MLSASENFRVSQRHHEAIFTNIEQRRPQEAHRAMHADIADAFELLKRFF